MEVEIGNSRFQEYSQIGSRDGIMVGDWVILV